MSYTKRDYESIAGIIAQNVSQTVVTGEAKAARMAVLQSVAHGLAIYFAATNARFEIERFLRTAKCPPVETIQTQETIQNA